MATLAQINEHKRRVTDITTLAVDELVSLFREFSLDDAARAQAQMIELLPLLGDEYADMISVASGDWYEDLRAEAVGGRYTARLADPPRDGQYRALAGWAAQPLYENGDTLLVLSRLTGGLQRLIRQSGRETIIENADSDPVNADSEVRYRRATAAGACAFCAMLATRGAVYHDEQVETNITGRRWKFKAHDFCNCEPVPVFPGDDMETPSWYADYESAYKAAVQRVGNSADTKAILAAMREILGSN